jgi:hypothetical protein
MPLPVFISAGVANGTTGNGVPDYPTGWLPGDFLMLFCETNGDAVSAPSGWTEFADSPQSATGTRLTIYYRRAEFADTPTVTITDPGNHIYSVIMNFRGVVETGDPWDVTSGGTDNTSNTTVSFGGDTTTVANTLVVVACARSSDISGVEFASFANADLANFAEVSDNGTAQGDGGGIGIAVGEKAAVGAYGTTTATLTTAATKAFMTIALKPAAGPWFRAVGVNTGAATALSVAWPAGHVADDIGVLILETENQAITVSGWTEFTNSPQGTGTGGSAGSTRLTAFWKRATSSAEADAATNDSGDHQVGAIYVFRNCTASGDPYDSTTGGVVTPASTSASMTGVTTSVDNCLVLSIVTFSTDISAGTPQLSAWANATLQTFGEMFEGSATAGNGGGYGMGAGFKATAGATGTSTATLATSSTQGWMTIALRATGGAAAVTRFYASIVG